MSIAENNQQEDQQPEKSEGFQESTATQAVVPFHFSNLTNFKVPPKFAILSLPRCGSAWLATQLGRQSNFMVLHDPLTEMSVSQLLNYEPPSSFGQWGFVCTASWMYTEIMVALGMLGPDAEVIRLADEVEFVNQRASESGLSGLSAYQEYCFFHGIESPTITKAEIFNRNGFTQLGRDIFGLAFESPWESEFEYWKKFDVQWRPEGRISKPQNHLENLGLLRLNMEALSLDPKFNAFHQEWLKRNLLQTQGEQNGQ